MRFSAILCLAAVIALAASVSAASAASSTTKAHDAHVVAHHVRIPKTAEALSPPVAPVVRHPETDGLSRDREDCNMGCIDNN